MAGQNPGSPTEFQYFYEDEVYKINNRGQVVFGLVLENFEANSSDEDSEAEIPIQKGEVRIVWHPSGVERVISEKSVGLADRSLMPGDVVRRMIRGKDTQRGYCRDIVVSAAVQVVGTGLVLPAVPSDRLQPLEEFTADLAVCLDSWVGTSRIVHSKMRLVSSDGSRLEYPDVNSCPLEDCIQRRRRGVRGVAGAHLAATEYYAGQVVAGPLGALDHATWLHTTKDMKAARRHKMREHKFTVEAVETQSVSVQWQCRGLGEAAVAGPPQQPRFLVEGEDLHRLRLLNLFEPCTLQVGARNFMSIEPADVAAFCSKGQWRRNQGKIYRTLRRQSRPTRTRDTKENVTKDANGISTLAQDTNTKHSFRISTKPKKRLSIHNREVKIVCVHNDNKSHHCPITKDSTECANKEDRNTQVKMEVDVVISDGETATNGDVPLIETKDQELEVDKLNLTSKPSASPYQSDENVHLEVPDATWNGRGSTSDRSNSPENPETSDRLKKHRKSRFSNSSHGSDSAATLNGEHKGSQTILSELDDTDDWDISSTDDGTDTDSCATWSSHCSSSPNNSLASGRGKKSPQLVTKFLKGKRLKRTARREPVTPQPKAGDKVVVETLCTTSKANVVWQDGTIEEGIPSTELYPIHHLDGQECFPGDFVVGEGASHRDYGVVQRVDHHGRTAVVKWFRTYTSCQEPVPQLISESEVSVYDLKDHPDFQYRPGTVVIRVANFTGTEATCTAGQVIDNFPTGRVNVWWVDGHTSMCWPQDLYKVGEYDSDEGDLWPDDGTGSDDSWETQSSVGSGERLESRGPEPVDLPAHGGAELLTATVPMSSVSGVIGEFPKVPRCLEPRAAAHIERGRAAMAKLEEMFSQNPALQNQEIMRKLLNLYKDCRFLDRLMGTSFFHEDHFQGLLERVRERGGNRDSPGGVSGVRRVQDQVMRLFSKDDADCPPPADSADPSEKDLCTPVNPKELPEMTSKQSSEDILKTAANMSPLPHVEINNLSLIGDQFSNVLLSIEIVKCGNEGKDPPFDIFDNDDNLVETKSLTQNMGTDAGCGKHISKNSSCEGDVNLKDPLMDVRFTSSSSEGSLSKYATPAGSSGDLSIPVPVDKSPGDKTSRTTCTEDSGVDSQSLSISHSTNNTFHGEFENSFHSSEFPSQDSVMIEKTLKAPVTAPVSSSPETQLSTRNVCLKLCSLINIQMMKACAEVSKRRRLVLADFLNKVMTVQNSPETPLPYSFSVQYDALVVTMSDGKTSADNDKENIEDSKMETSETLEVVPQKEPENGSEIEKSPSTEEAAESEASTVAAMSPDCELGEGFVVLESAPNVHRFRLSMLQPSEPRVFHSAVRREIKLLKSDLPPGVWVRGYEDRLDLLSIMIAGPAKTPYEDGLFLFDVQLGGEYPRAPPLCHYISYCSDRLNPNLYEDGKVCVSLLGTWSGRGVEVWGKESSLLQVIVSLQGLILCAEPYFNEAGYEKQKGSQQGSENSRMYNEMVLLKLVQSLTKIISNPPEVFRMEIMSHQSRHSADLCSRLERWMRMSEEYNNKHVGSPLTPGPSLAALTDAMAPEYPLVPASRGFCLTLRSSLESYRNALRRAGIDLEKAL